MSAQFILCDHIPIVKFMQSTCYYGDSPGCASTSPTDMFNVRRVLQELHWGGDISNLTFSSTTEQNSWIVNSHSETFSYITNVRMWLWNVNIHFVFMSGDGYLRSRRPRSNTERVFDWVICVRPTTSHSVSTRAWYSGGTGLKYLACYPSPSKRLLW